MKKKLLINLSFLFLFTFICRLSPVYAATTSRLTLPVSTNATLVVSTTGTTTDKKIIVSDHLSSTRVVLNEDGTKSSDLSYYPYGSSLNESQVISTSFNDRYYTGQRKIPGDNLYNYNARFYNPTLGVFTQPDTVEGPNRFAYVGGNPIMKNDPSGHMACPQCQDRYSANPVEADPIPDPLTYIKVLAKYAGLYDIGIIGNMAFDTVTGIGYREDNDPIAAASAKLDRYISKSDAGNAEVAGMMQPMSVVSSATLTGAQTVSRSSKLSQILSGRPQTYTASGGQQLILHPDDPNLRRFIADLDVYVAQNRTDLSVSRSTLVENFVRENIRYSEAEQQAIYASRNGKAYLGDFYNCNVGVCREMAVFNHLGLASQGKSSEMVVANIGAGRHAWAEFTDTVTGLMHSADSAYLPSYGGIVPVNKAYDIYQGVRDAQRYRLATAQ